MNKFNLMLLHSDLFPERKVDTVRAYANRPTVKVVLSDSEDKICLISKTGSDFYLLPGGGIEEGETPIEALRRECLEESGCSIVNEEETGIVTEYRDEKGEKRTVTCYKAAVQGDKGKPHLAKDDEGFDVIWSDVQDAIWRIEKQLESITGDTDNFYTRKFNAARDLRILQQVSWPEMAGIQS